jgi:hypothetical protein
MVVWPSTLSDLAKLPDPAVLGVTWLSHGADVEVMGAERVEQS